MTSINDIVQRNYLDENAAYKAYMALLSNPTLAAIRAALGCWTYQGQYVHCTNNLGINFIILNPEKVMAATGENPLPLIIEALQVKHEDTARLLLWGSVQDMLRASGRYSKLLRDAYVHRGMNGHSSWVKFAREGGVTDERINAMMLSRLRLCLAGATHPDTWVGTPECEEVWSFFDGPDNDITPRAGEGGCKRLVLASDTNLFGLTDEGVMEAVRLVLGHLRSGHGLLSDWRRIAGRLHERPDLQDILWDEIMAGLQGKGLSDSTMGEVKKLDPPRQLDALRYAGAYGAPTAGLDTWQFGGHDAFRLLVELCLILGDPTLARSLFTELLVKFEAFDPIKLLRVVCQKEWWADDNLRLGRGNEDASSDSTPGSPDLVMLAWMRSVLEPRVREAGYGIGEVFAALPESGGQRFVAAVDGHQVIHPLGLHRYRPRLGHRVAVRLSELASSGHDDYQEAVLLPLSA